MHSKAKKIDTGLIVLYIAYSTCSAFGYWRSAREAFLYMEAWLLQVSFLQKPVFTPGGIALLILFVLLFLDFYFELWCDQRPIQGIPCIQGGLPIVGNLFQQGPSATMTYWRWGPEVFQLRLGTKRVVVANSFDAIHHLWQTNWLANISRPTLYTFHKIMSTSQGTTIGTTPYSESWKRMRKAIASNLNAAAIKSYEPIIDRQSAKCIERLSKMTNQEISVHSYFATFALCIVTKFQVL